jgi:hypothetical protein
MVAESGTDIRHWRSHLRRRNLERRKHMKVYVDIQRTFGTIFWLTKVSPDYEKDSKGNRASDTVIGYQYAIVTPEREYDKHNVKIPGKQLMVSPTEAEGAIEVVFEGLDATPYVRDGWIQLSVKAKGIKAVQHKT